MMHGFYIRKLSVSGTRSSPASIQFKKGANLITGASDTGKSYIFSALMFALGDSEPPKEIIEASGYNQIFVEICTHRDEKVFTLMRQIGQNKIDVKECLLEAFSTSVNTHKVYAAKGSTDSISSFLLSLCDLNNKRTLKNKTTGATENFSWKNLLKLTFIDEIEIIKLTSPFYYSQQYFDQIKAQAMLSILLTGQDYSNVIEKEDKRIRETRINGKLEFLNYQISQYAQDKDELIDKINKTSSIDDSQRFLELDAELKKNLSQAKELAKQKNQIVLERQSVIEQKHYKTELKSRFAILKKQYKSDAERLEFILEAKVLSEQLGDVVCPICSSPLDHNGVLHIQEKEEFSTAAIEELKKNKSKLIGLEDTLNNLNSELSNLDDAITSLNNRFSEVERQLTENLSTRIQELKSDLRGFLDYEKMVNGIAFIDDQISKLHKEKSRLEKVLNENDPRENIDLLPFSLLRGLADQIQKRLSDWNYEQFVKVDFNDHYQTFDIVINGKSRKSFGKGKRGISFTACLIGLLDYCTQHTRPFSNLLVLDSPITTFEEKKNAGATDVDVLKPEVLKAFFTNLANLPTTSQVIIFDNKEPDAATAINIREKVYIQQFTGNENTGRYGFFPMTR